MSNQYTIRSYTNEEINEIIALYQNDIPYSMISRKLKRSSRMIKNILIERGIYVNDNTKGKFKKNLIPHNKKNYTQNGVYYPDFMDNISFIEIKSDYTYDILIGKKPSRWTKKYDTTQIKKIKWVNKNIKPVNVLVVDKTKNKIIKKCLADLSE